MLNEIFVTENGINKEEVAELTSVTINNERYYRISDVDKMPPFFMSIVSDSNHWMFISSNGGLTAGRKNAEYSLFPYYTDDKITEFAHTTGSATIFHVLGDGSPKVWEPFCRSNAIRFDITRNLYKNRFGDKVLFEEINHDLGATFRYEWKSSDKYGFVKESTVINHSDGYLHLGVLDGIQNVLPASVVSDLQTRSSNLLDAYKRSELVKETGLGIYALSAIPVDKAEPSEALMANVVWSIGLDNPTYLLSSLQLEAFRSMEPISEETDIKGEKGAYFVQSRLDLAPNSESKWAIVANTYLDHSRVVELNQTIKDSDGLYESIDADVELGTQNLKNLIAASDGFQSSADELKDGRHYSNVLFNIMRGGIFDLNYQIEKWDFSKYLANANKDVFERNESIIESLPDEFDKSELDSKLETTQDADFLRLAKEYLPLKFSRRHGDPSRPWNKFSINTVDEKDGSKVLDYEGNWRDIFQNWEALVYSYPSFIEAMIFKFLNASTFDGYNPYRVTKGGFDWEIIEPDDPWSYIGYWGDHQVIYLLKFLEFYNDHNANGFDGLLGRDLFVYANVPYRIKSYSEIVENPKDTIDFDDESDSKIREQVEENGADGALLGNQSGSIHHVNFMEKILATVLSKVSNFVPEAGIWMNTQRPEWNDANNALVGNGVSMVTLYYLRRFLRFFEPVLSASEVKEVLLSDELVEFLGSVNSVLEAHSGSLNARIDDQTRKSITDGLGEAGSSYRNSVYGNGFSGKRSSVRVDEIADLVKLTNRYLEHSIEANHREDNLYHAYNILSFEGEGISISYLDEMLEGQVAVLSSGYLKPEEALRVLDALKASSLYRQDQNSYVLYPNKELPGFLQRNSVPEALVNQSELLKTMVADGNTNIVSKDIEGVFHFNGAFKNAGYLAEALDDLIGTTYSELASQDREIILDVFETVFNHKAFTGRSGTFYGYEGLGSIYWHMVSKLYLAVMEVCADAADNGTDSGVRDRLAEHFHEIGEGIGVHKSPKLYGAFPIDPYSHTPFRRGAQQPGMTGQVKEDILARYGELGLGVREGRLFFSPGILSKNDFSNDSKEFELIDLDQQNYSIQMPEGSLGFTLCQVPIVYTISDVDSIKVEYRDGSSKQFSNLSLDQETSDQLFQREGLISQLSVSLKEEHLI